MRRARARSRRCARAPADWQAARRHGRRRQRLAARTGRATPRRHRRRSTSSAGGCSAPGSRIARATLHVRHARSAVLRLCADLVARAAAHRVHPGAPRAARGSATYRDSPIALALEQDVVIRRRLEGNKRRARFFPCCPTSRARASPTTSCCRSAAGHGRPPCRQLRDRPGPAAFNHRRHREPWRNLAELMGILIDHFTLEQSARAT